MGKFRNIRGGGTSSTRSGKGGEGNPGGAKGNSRTTRGAKGGRNSTRGAMGCWGNVAPRSLPERVASEGQTRAATLQGI